jgi:hypothetical protein
VGLFEQYTIILDDVIEISYENNDVAHPKGSAQWGNECVEFQFLDASDYVDPEKYCIRVTAGGSQDLNFSEDEMYVCIDRTRPPEIDFNYTGTDCLEVTFNAWAINDSIVNWTWYFGPGASPASDSGFGPFVPEIVTFDSCGPKTVTLVACNDDDCDIEIKDDVVVACGPTAVIKADGSCFELNGTEITFDGSDSYGGTLPYTYSWDFGNLSGDNDNGAITKVMVTEPITATLTVTDALNCSNTTERTIDECSGCLIRIYGTFGQGAGDNEAVDPETGLKPENWPYTDPVGPFHPQHPQAPRKDFITFNPAIMDHNQAPPGSDDDYDELDFGWCSPTDVQRPVMKVFKRMWYEKEWFKDHNGDGCFTVIIDKWDEKANEWKFDRTECLEDYNKIPQWQKVGERIREWNDDETAYGESDSDVDIYAPAIIQEFTYMTLDGEKMPILVTSGSNLLIPMASWVPNNGIDSFDADGDGYRDAVRVESELTLNMDIDGDGLLESMDNDDDELSGDESVVLVLTKDLKDGDSFQFFDHKVKLLEHDDDEARLNISDNEGGGSVRFSLETLEEDETMVFYRAEAPNMPVEPPNFYVTVKDILGTTVTLEVGRMFGQTYANIGSNPNWNQKAFIVDGVFYNVVAIKALDNCFKFITFRQKLPKMAIKLYQKHLLTWDPLLHPILPEMPPFNERHEIIDDIQTTWTEPHIQQDKIGKKITDVPPLEIILWGEDKEKRFKGQLMEIYNETHTDEWLEEYWNLEWFHTQPWQYTEFVMPTGQKLYLMTLAWYARQAEITFWDDQEGPIANYKGERVKFWYDPANPTDIYVNRAGEAGGPPVLPDELWKYYDMATNGGDGQGDVDENEVIRGLMDYLDHRGAFAVGPWGQTELINYLVAFLLTT